MILVFVAVVGARFLLPLTIPRYPLPGIIACLILDGIDQSIFQAFGYDPPGYQSYDKALDIYYLSIAYLSTMRNWTNLTAFTMSRFLFYYRLVGVVADHRGDLAESRGRFRLYVGAVEVEEAVRARPSARP